MFKLMMTLGVLWCLVGCGSASPVTSSIPSDTGEPLNPPSTQNYSVSNCNTIELSHQWFDMAASNFNASITTETETYSSCKLIDSAVLESKPEKMPFYIKRNENSKVFIIHLHGGPGGTIRPWAYAGNAIHYNYNVVYLQQRGSGSATGPSYFAEESAVLLARMLNDLEVLIDTLHNIYDEEGAPIKVFLSGESWGVYYGLLYFRGKFLF